MILFNEAQIQQLKEISTLLKQARQEKSIAIEQIAAQTLIRPALLLALEEGRFEELPELVFVQGFIRRYGDALGLDGNTLAYTLVSNVFHLDSNDQSKNLNQKRVIHIPLFLTYIVLLIAASTGLFYLLHPQFSSQSLSPKVTTQQSLVNGNKETITDN